MLAGKVQDKKLFMQSRSDLTSGLLHGAKGPAYQFSIRNCLETCHLGYSALNYTHLLFFLRLRCRACSAAARVRLSGHPGSQIEILQLLCGVGGA